MPRGATTRSRRKKTTVQAAPEVPKKKRGKAMEKSVPVGSKRKHKATPEVAESEGAPAAPVTKKPKASSSATTEETDRAVFVRDPPKPKSKKVVVVVDESDKISHPSHRQQPGEVMTFGQGDIGQLGLGEDIDERKKPSPVGGPLEGLKVVQVVCGGMHTVALTDQGQVYTWGCNDEGALGRPTEDGEEYTPGLVKTLESVVVVQVSAGDCHTVFLANTGLVYCCGIFRDSNGPFGLTTPGVSSPLPIIVYNTPSNKAVKVVSGSDHVVVLTTNGDLYSFGCAEQGQLGRVPECFSARGGRKGVQYLLDPQMVRFQKTRGRGAKSTKFLDIFSGSYTTFAYSQSRRLYAWGLNNYGQLGVDDVDIRFVPEQLPSDCLDTAEDVDDPRPELEIVGGQHHSLLCHRGRVFVMGRREYGRLGLGEDETEPAVPTRLPSLSDIASVGAGSVCSFAVSHSGQAYSWGMGTSLQLGSGKEDDIWKPTIVTGKKLDNRKVIAASAGGQHTALLVSLPYDS